MSINRKARKRARSYNAILASFEAKQPKAPHVENTRGIPAVDASHRTGKRRRGNSVTKQAPRETTYVSRTVDVFDENGVCIASDLRMLTYRREP